MLCGLQALRVHQFTHRDIKTENVLYDETTGVYKLTYFGLAENYNKLRRSQKGSPGYILPKSTTIILIWWQYKNL